MKRIFQLLFLICMFSSCVINKRVFYEYSTNLPGYTMPEYNRIDKSAYRDYFLNDVYLTVTIFGRYYPSEQVRVRGPYSIMFRAVSKNTRYKTMRINNCTICSNIKPKYNFDCLPAEFIFDDGKYYNNDIFYYSPRKWNTYPIDLDIKASEIIEISFELVLIDENDKEYKKQMKYIVKPDIKTKYIETILDWW